MDGDQLSQGESSGKNTDSPCLDEREGFNISSPLADDNSPFDSSLNIVDLDDIEDFPSSDQQDKKPNDELLKAHKQSLGMVDPNSETGGSRQSRDRLVEQPQSECVVKQPSTEHRNEKSGDQYHPSIPPSHPSQQHQASGDASLDMDALLNILGIDTERLSDTEKKAILIESMKVLKESVVGIMGVLASRNALKSEFRVNMTHIQAHENNPLKFSVSADDAITNMFARNDRAYLGAVESVNEGLRDISDHQMALLAGIKLGMKQLVNRFDPKVLIKNFEAAGAKGGFMKAKTAVYWELYQNYYTNEVQNDDFFNMLFWLRVCTSL